MFEAVRLVIWDLDETFWSGTLVEGGLNENIHYAETVKELSKRGIMNSICSKNDFSSAREILERLGVWDFFIFPSINWSSKGERVQGIVDRVKLRPETIMFIDDNSMNLREVSSVVPNIQIENEKFIPRLLSDPRFVGKNDNQLKRLADYKILEEKNEILESRGGDSHAFLRDSGITVEFDYDIENNIPRVIEIINRTNQLNFTKNRLSDDIHEAEKQIREEISHYDRHAALVRVRDRFGDYGYVGFFLQARGAGYNNLKHFCFSCRTLGMYIEKWIYDYLGAPDVNVVGDVLTDLSDATIIPDWISIYQPDLSEVETLKGTGGTILLCGGCDLDAVSHYVKATFSRTALFANTMRLGAEIRRDHSSMLRRAFEGLHDDDGLFLRQLGYSTEDSALGILPSDVDVAVLSFWADMFYPLYEVVRRGYRMPYAPLLGCGHANIEDIYEIDLWNRGAVPENIEIFRFAKANLKYLNVIDKEEFQDNVRTILGYFRPDARIFLMNALQQVPKDFEWTRARHSQLNEWQAEIAQEFPNVVLVNVDEFMLRPEDAVSSTHFVRDFYRQVGLHLCSAALE